MVKKDICFATFARNEKIRLPVWLSHYQQFASNEDIYVIDQNTTDGSTTNLLCNIIYEPNEKIFDHQWLRHMITKNVQLLLTKYRIVVMTECDELMVTINNCKLDEYLINKYKVSNINVCTKLVNLVQHNSEESYDNTKKISCQRSYWDDIDARKHTIFTNCNFLIENGFHNGDGIYDINLITFHIEALNLEWVISKIQNRINEKNVFGQGDNHCCWNVYYTENKINEYLNYDYNNLTLIPDFFKNNSFI
jgi:hypothetical protein